MHIQNQVFGEKVCEEFENREVGYISENRAKQKILMIDSDSAAQKSLKMIDPLGEIHCRVVV